MTDRSNQGRNILIFIGIIAVAFNLRPAITSVGPIIGDIQHEMQFNTSTVSLLTTFPLLAFSAISSFAPIFAKRWGIERTLFCGLTLIGLGIFMRSTNILFILFVGTFMIGIGIGICNVLLPSLVKAQFPLKVGLITGIYTLAMGVFAGFAPGISGTLSSNGITWEPSLLIWAIPVILACILWIPFIKKRPKINPVPLLSFSTLFKSGIAWQITGFMGLQSFIYFGFSTWLPEILLSKGFTLEMGGWMLTVMQFSGLPASFFIPILGERLAHQKWIGLGIGSTLITGLCGLFLTSSTVISFLSIILIGLSLGAAISHSLALMSLRSMNSEQAASLSGMAQSFGYLLAACGPFLLGFLYDLFHQWHTAFFALITVAILFTLCGIGAGRNVFVQETTNLKQIS
ncbi:MFS transporter [Cytobacillus sp. Sa5YUA1]|uniref:MFS transporter n=1 Tax=Cytobacillus stercorigallinarum TaxID=2762240 RepID=A0ABR8QSU5_9BACI|nr:MFS transporter [Cytobacillus stercorigallinarum]MBD7938605.1 MFS transporter [Cytobacillus stercorigallinarum]